jgi:hypothetical protein
MERKFEIEVLQKHGEYVREIVSEISDKLTRLEQSSGEEHGTPSAETAALLEGVAELLIRLAGEVGTFDRRLLEVLKKIKTGTSPS